MEEGEERSGQIGARLPENPPLGTAPIPDKLTKQWLLC